MKRTFVVLLGIFLCSLPPALAQGDKKSYRATRTASPPVIDGVIGESEWTEGSWDGNFVQFEPDNGAPAKQKTEFKVFFDENNIYVAIKAYDNAADSISRRISRRDNADGDFVGVAFDSYHDLRTGFVFVVNAAGVKNDFIWSNDGQNEDETWDPIWFTKTAMFDWGWSAEIRIPLSQLRFKITDGGLWGMEVLRNLYRHQEFSTWQFIDRTASGIVHCFGQIEGLQGIKPRKQADITPFAVGSYERYEEESGNPFASGNDFKYNAGLDAKIGLTNDITLDLTVNPDFGQVEADPSQVNLTAYETFFEEKRPFFIEGKSITSFKIGIGDGDLGNDNLFYSRRIGRNPHIWPTTQEGEYASSPRNAAIISAAKVTGKTANGLSVGLLEAVTAETKAEIDSLGQRSYQTIEPLTNYLVSRVIKDFNQGQTIIGGAYTNTYRFLEGTGINGLVTTANTAGIDFTHYFDKEKNWMLTTSAAMSNLNGSNKSITALQYSSVHYYQRPDADYVEIDTNRTSLNGHGGNVQIGKVGGKWNFALFGLWKSPGLDINDLGYMQSADELNAIAWTAYTIDKPFSIFRRLRFNANQWNFWDWGGTFLGTGGNISAYSQFKNLWWVNFGANFNSQRTDNSVLRGGPSMYMPSNTNFFMGFGSNSSKTVSFEIFGNLNQGAENSSLSYHTEMEITAKPGQSFSVSLAPGISNRMNTMQYVSRRSYNDDDRYILGTLEQQILSMSVRLNYNITPELTIQYWGQPFIASMNYDEYKMVTYPKADELNSRYHIYTQEEISLNETDNEYDVDENRDGVTDYSFRNPDGNFDEFLSNLVVRWEYRPGSTIFLVWSQNRSYFDNIGTFSFNNNINNLFEANKPYNTFLVKFTYRFGLR